MNPKIFAEKMFQGLSSPFHNIPGKDEGGIELLARIRDLDQPRGHHQQFTVRSEAQPAEERLEGVVVEEADHLALETRALRHRQLCLAHVVHHPLRGQAVDPARSVQAIFTS